MIKKLHLFLVLSFFICLNTVAQYTQLHEFSIYDGIKPYSSLTIDGNVMYGTTSAGGYYGNGTIFKMNKNGSGYTDLYDFDGIHGKDAGSLILSGDILYGASHGGGANDFGCIFSINADGTGYKDIFDFGYSANAMVPLDLTLSGNTLYGVAAWGGDYSNGCIYKINIDGTGFTKLYTFSQADQGVNPIGPIIISGNILYGTMNGSLNANTAGILYKINTDGSGYATLHNFVGDMGKHPGKLTLSGNVLYGITSDTNGTIFKINTDGSGYTELLPYGGAAGSYPVGSLTLSNNVLYGMTRSGGMYGAGNAYKINTDGSGYSSIFDFGSLNPFPLSSLTLSNDTMYGTSYQSVNGTGTIFCIVPPPSIQASNISFTGTPDHTMTIKWTNGNGSKRAVFMKSGTGAITNPTNYTQYGSDGRMYDGSQLGYSEYYCVYNGSDSVATVNAYCPPYSVQIFEYSGDNIPGAPKYLTSTASGNPNIYTRPLEVTGGISGSQIVCQEQTVNYSVSPITNATEYVWSLPFGATITDGFQTNNITVDFSSIATSGDVSVYGTNDCEIGAAITIPVMVNPLPDAVGGITGTATVCPGQTNVTYSVEAIANVSGYTWSLPSGATITAGENTNSITVSFSNTAIDGDVSVYGTNSCGNGASATLPVKINLLPASVVSGFTPVCAGTYSYFWVPTIENATDYVWSIPQGATLVSGEHTGQVAVYFSNIATSGDVSVYYTNSCGNGTTSSALAVTVNRGLPDVAGVISGSSSVCVNQQMSFSVPVIPNATSYEWTSPYGSAVTSGMNTNNVTISFNNPYYWGNSSISVHGVNGCGIGNESSNHPVTVNPVPLDAGIISGPTTVCQGQSAVAYSVPEITFATGYTWAYSGTGAIINGATKAITINFASNATSGILTVYGTNSCGKGSSSSTLAVTVSNTTPGNAETITGISLICQDRTRVAYSVPEIPNAVGYVWSLPQGATIVTGANSNLITVDFSPVATSGNVSVYGMNGCGNGAPASLPITINPLPGEAGNISGLGSVCLGQTNVNYSVPVIANATGYIWYLPTGATITSGNNTNSVIVSFSNIAISGDVFVYGTNSCGNDAAVSLPVIVRSLVGAAGIISGRGTVCSGQSNVTYNIPSKPNATGYTWSLPPGATITAGNNTNGITVSFSNTATNGNVSVYGTNSCGNGTAASLLITVNPLPGAAGIISGTASVCPGQTGVTYSTAITNATGYVWTLPQGATIITGANTNTIKVGFSGGATSGNVSVYGTNSCGNGTSASLPITVASLVVAAGTISGTGTACAGQTSIIYSVPTITNATGYVWTVPSGASIATGANTNRISVNFSGTATSGNVSVYGTNVCGNGASSSLPITVNPLPGQPGAVSGITSVCSGQTYITYGIPALSNATGYAWSLPSGATITAGANTNSISVSFSNSAVSGNVSVYGTNSCGNGPAAALPITVNPLPDNAGTITGLASICKGQTGVAYSVSVIPNATGYVWSLPSGAIITSGANTRSITVSFSDISTGGDITVYGTNSCGNGIPSTFNVSIITPPQITSQPIDQNISCEGTSSFNVGATGTNLSYQWLYSNTGGASFFNINGANSSNYSTNVNNYFIGYQYKCKISNACGTIESNVAHLAASLFPQITIQPTNQTICNGETASFTVEGKGSNVTYTWMFSEDGGATFTYITGANDATYTVPVADIPSGYLYACEVSDDCNIINSNAVGVTVNNAPQITAQPQPLNLCEGVSANFTVNATGTNLTYQWYDGLTPLTDVAPYAGSSTSVLIITNATPDLNGKQYQVIITGACGSPVTSNAAVLSVNAMPEITSQPANQALCAGETASLSFGVTGSDLTYQWQERLFNWKDIAGKRSPTCNLSASAEMHGRLYRCVVTNGSCTVISSTARFTLGPQITNSISDQADCEGATVIFGGVTAIGPSPFTYRWQESADGNTWNYISSATSPSYSVTIASPLDGHFYRCVVGGTCGFADTSNVAKLTIPYTKIKTPLTDQTVCENGGMNLSIDATGANLNYQWQNRANASASWANIDGANQNLFVLWYAPTDLNGYQYRCIVGGKCGDPVTSNEITMTVTPLPKIILQPVSQQICEGETVTFTTTGNTSDLTYQWYEQLAGVWTPIDGATNASCNVLATSANNGRNYNCKITGTCSIYCDVVKLTVKLLPHINTNPVSRTICQGSSATLEVEAVGTDLSIQWQQSPDSTIWTDISGMTGSECTIVGDPEKNGYWYRCVASGSCGDPVNSNPAQLTVTTSPVLLAQPTDKTVVEGDVVVFNVNASGAEVNYQWQNSIAGPWVNMEGKTSNTLEFQTTTSSAGFYRCLVGPSCITKPAFLQVDNKLMITTQPVNQEFCEGATASFNISATGFNIQYQWQKSINGVWTNISPETSDVFEVIASASNVGDYRCIVVGYDNVHVTSDVVHLIVDSNPLINSSNINNQTICEGSTVTIGSITATGHNLKYQWQESVDSIGWKDISGAANANYTPQAQLSMDGHFFHCVVTGPCGFAVTSSAMQLTVIPETFVTKNPSNVYVCPGTTVNFDIEAVGQANTYQWSGFDGTSWTEISGATGTTYSTMASSGGLIRFNCKATGTCGTATSDTVNIVFGVLIIKQPQDKTLCQDSTAQFTCKASGQAPFSYQWIQSTDSLNWSILGGETAAVLNTIASTSNNGNYFSCIVTANCGRSDTTSGAKLRLNDTLTIKEQPRDTLLCEGSTPSFTFFVKGAKGGTLKYRWEQSTDGVSWVEIPSATSNNYQFLAVFAMNNYQYRCKVRCACNDASWTYSNVVRLTVARNDLSVAVAVSPLICEGKNGGAIAITCTGGTQPYTFSWSNGSSAQNLASLPKGTYTVTVFDKYSCKVTHTESISPEAPMVANPKITNITFAGDSVGKIDPVVTGGHSPLSYQWYKKGVLMEGATGSILADIHASEYKLVVTDAKLCTMDVYATVNEPSTPSKPSKLKSKKDVIIEPGCIEGRTLDLSLDAGTIPGSASVTPSGAMSYGIPIVVPPGVGGLVPQISLVYNSQAGNGLLGWGSNLGGISAITRVPNTIYSNGSAKGVEITTNDNYALDGNLLILKSGTGTYGTDNSQYGTENESFVNIIAHGSYGNNGPEQFEVQTKNGTKYKYGSISGDNSGKLIYSEPAFLGGKFKTAVLAWFLDRVEDVNGNYIEYTYEQHSMNIYLRKISYGDNTKKSTGNTNTVELSYGSRDDSIPLHYGNEKGYIDHILTNIEIKNGNALLRNYSIEYAPAGNFDHFSRLKRITESTGDSKKINPTIFKWGDPTPWMVVDSLVSLEIGPNNKEDINNQNFAAIDLSGDGLDDIMDFNGGQNHLADAYYTSITPTGVQYNKGQNSQDPYMLPEDFNPAKLDVGAYNFGDINGDGKKEMIVPTYSSLKDGSKVVNFWYYLYLSQVPSKDEIRPRTMEASSELPLVAVDDINNDGFDEIIYIEKGGANGCCPGGIYKPKYKTWLYFGAYTPPNWQSDQARPEKIFVADFNGDGMKDIMIVSKSGYGIAYNRGGIKPTFSYITALNNTFTSDDRIQLGDFNGDGLPDFLVSKENNASTFMAINNGEIGFSKKILSDDIFPTDDNTKSDDNKDQVLVYDFNNDGKSDIVVVDAVYRCVRNWLGFVQRYEYNYTNVHWYESTGESLQLARTIKFKDEAASLRQLFVTGDFNGDGRTELMNYGLDCFNGTGNSKKWRMYTVPNSSNSQGLVTSVANGINQTSCFGYVPLSNSNKAYTKNVVHPAGDSTLSIMAPLYVVNNMQVDNGIGGKTNITYTYKDATIHTQGKGFLGYGQIKQTNTATNDSLITTSEFDRKYFTLKKQTINTSRSGKKLSQAINTYTYTPVLPVNNMHIYLSQYQSIATDLLNGNVVSTINHNNLNGDLSSTETDYGADNATYKKTEYTEYAATTAYTGVISGNFPKTIITTSKHKDSSPFPVKTTVNYNDNGTVESKTAFSGTANAIKTSYTYDDYGNVLTTSTVGETTRTITNTYDPTKRFVESSQNSLYPNVNYLFNTYDTWGNVTTQTDVNSLSTSFEYDSWGRMIQKKMPEKRYATYQYKWAGGNDAPTGALYYTSSTSYNSTGDVNATGAEYFDLLGRSLRKVTTGVLGIKKQYTDNNYNALGQLEQTTYTPVGGTVKSTKYGYRPDDGRLESELTSPDNITKTYQYDDKENKITTWLSTATDEKYSKTYDAAGLLTTASDPGGNISYQYHGSWKPQTITAPGGTTSIEYNDYGQQYKLHDPDAGTIRYTYTKFGELASQTDARGKLDTMVYDALGRITTKTSDGVKTSYTYDQGTQAMGTLTSVSREDGASSSYSYSNDGLCRLTKETRKNASGSFFYTYDYDANGRVSTLTYPNGFALTYNYTNYDDLIEIKHGAKSVWNVSDADFKNGLQKYAHYGNGQSLEYGYDTQERLNHILVPNVIDFNYQFNDKHQLEYREEKYSKDGLGFRESFTYDGVNRLNTVSGNDNIALTMAYKKSDLSAAEALLQTSETNDRILKKSNAGVYVYNNLSHVHAISSLSTVAGYQPTYHKLTYTAEGKVETIREMAKVDSVTDVEKKLVTLKYDVDNQRFSMEYKEAGVTKSTRYYFDNYEKEISATGTERHLNYIYVGGTLVAIGVQKDGTDSVFYVYTDRQGSLRCITDEAGKVRQTLSFDAWGNRRNPITGQRLTPLEKTELMFLRGFTGQEHLDSLGLINMNGRVYDPALGMFISPDNFVQAPDNTQSFNRYAYCVNNPLMYTDPTGYTWWSDFWDSLGKADSKAGTWLCKNISPSGGVGFNANFDGSGIDPNSVNLFATAGTPDAQGGVGYNPYTNNVGLAGSSNGDFRTVAYAHQNYDIAGQNAAMAFNKAAAPYHDAWKDQEWNNFYYDEGQYFGHSELNINFAKKTGSSEWWAKAEGGGLQPSFVDLAVYAPIAAASSVKAVVLASETRVFATEGAALLNVEQRSLQHMFTRHAKDFGVTSNWSKTAATEFEGVLRTHMEGSTPIQGTYRGTQQVLHYFNPSTGLNVMTDMSGNLVGGWRLGADQIKYLLSTGTVK